MGIRMLLMLYQLLSLWHKCKWKKKVQAKPIFPFPYSFLSFFFLMQDNFYFILFLIHVVSLRADNPRVEKMPHTALLGSPTELCQHA